MALCIQGQLMGQEVPAASAFCSANMGAQLQRKQFATVGTHIEPLPTTDMQPRCSAMLACGSSTNALKRLLLLLSNVTEGYMHRHLSALVAVALMLSQ